MKCETSYNLDSCKKRYSNGGAYYEKRKHKSDSDWKL